MKKQKLPPELRVDVSEYSELIKSRQEEGPDFGKIFLVLMGLFFFMIFLAVFGKLWGARVRVDRDRCRSDLRALVTGLELYYLDHSQYPSMEIDQTFPVKALTTPTSYLSDGDEYLDHFAKDPNQTYRYLYYKKPELYIILSNGPDKDQEITLSRIRKNADIEKKEEIEAFLESLAYDPTNGITSDGDILRTNHFIP